MSIPFKVSLLLAGVVTIVLTIYLIYLACNGIDIKDDSVMRIVGGAGCLSGIIIGLGLGYDMSRIEVE